MSDELKIIVVGYFSYSGMVSLLWKSEKSKFMVQIESSTHSKVLSLFMYKIIFDRKDEGENESPRVQSRHNARWTHIHCTCIFH